MSSPVHGDRFRKPSATLIDLIKRHSGGAVAQRGDYGKFMYRAVVVAVDVEGGLLENPDGPFDQASLTQELRDGENVIAKYDIKPTPGPRNPKGSVRARVISGDMDKFCDSDQLRTYWPMFPGLTAPSPGELVYVAFEDDAKKHGLWISRVPNDLADDNANFVMISDYAKSQHSQKGTLFPDSEKIAVTGSDGLVHEVVSPGRLTKLFSDEVPNVQR